MKKDAEVLFKELFYNAIEHIDDRYPNKVGVERDILGYIINNMLSQVILDIDTLDFNNFYSKYLQGSMFLDYDDFTKTELIQIINESKLSDRDKKLANLYWVQLKPEDSIAEELQIDRKTVRSNIPKISYILKRTASKVIK